MQNNQDIKKTKFIFCFIILLSNASLYLLMSPSGRATSQTNQSILRDEHITIKIKAELMVPFSVLTPVTLISKRSIIKNVFLLKEIENSKVSIEDSFSKSKEYFIEVHKSEFDKIKNSTSFKIYPNEINHKLSKSKRSNIYELTY